MGRARLGGIPCGVIAVETRSVEKVQAADPADANSQSQTFVQAGQVRTEPIADLRASWPGAHGTVNFSRHQTTIMTGARAITGRGAADAASSDTWVDAGEGGDD